MKDNQNDISRSPQISLSQADKAFLGGIQINLLEKIEELGSITRAAKAVGICYKTAWDTIHQINLMAEKPLVDRQIGGRGGGGSCLTPEGKLVITQFKSIQEEHRKFLENQEERLGYTGSVFNFLRRTSAKISARNTFIGIVSSICRSSLYAEVTLALNGGLLLTAVVSNAAIDNLKLTTGMEAYAIVKAGSVIVATGLHTNARVIGGNLFSGTIATITQGTATTEVDIQTDGGIIVSADITHGNFSSLGLKTGDYVCALFQASNVILGVS